MSISMFGQSDNEILIRCFVEYDSVRTDNVGKYFDFLPMLETGVAQSVVPQIEKTVARMTQLTIQSKDVFD